MNDFLVDYENATGEKPMYRKELSDFHTLRYVTWLENKIKDDRALLEEAVKLIKENQRMIEATQDIYGEGDYDKEIYGNNKSFLTRAKERLGK